MPVAIEGVYSSGRVELKDKAPTEATSRVIVTFLDVEAEPTAGPKARLRERALARMEQGLDLGGPPYPSREELHARGR